MLFDARSLKLVFQHFVPSGLGGSVTVAELVLFFVIQRGAMQFSMYDELFHNYGIPEEVRWQWDQGN